MNHTKRDDLALAVIILLLSPIITYVVTALAIYDRGYFAVGGEVFVPFILIGASVYFIFRR